MENLQPLEAYTEAITAIWTRQGWLVGTALGAVMALATFWMVARGVGTDGVLAISLFVFVGGGWLFGFAWSRSMMRSMRAMTEAVYNGVSPFGVITPSGNYRYRLPASLRTSDRFAIGGVLFIGHDVMAFVPHGRNLPAHRQSITIPIHGECRIESIPQRLTAFRRLSFGTPPALVRVSSKGESWLFLVPRPEDTAEKIRGIVAG